jgi:hypothetical protein
MVVVYFRVISQNLLEQLRTTAAVISQNSQFSGPDSKLGPHDYKVGLLTTRQQLLIQAKAGIALQNKPPQLFHTTRSTKMETGRHLKPV